MLLLLVVSFVSAQEGRQRREPNTLSETEKKIGFQLLFDGKTVDKDIWQGDIENYKVVDGTIVCEGKNLMTKKEYDNFVFRFEFKLPPAGNNGVGIRTKLNANAAYDGYEIQILDDTAEQYKTLLPYQFHGSVYRFVPAKQGSLRPVGEWNREDIVVYKNNIRVVCNNQIIVDTDMTEFVEGKKKSLDTDHPEHVFNEKGLVGFLGHQDPVAFRNIRICEIKSPAEYKMLLEASERAAQRRQRGN